VESKLQAKSGSVMVNRNPLDSFNMSMSQADFEQGEECENSICAQNF
jgi:hypothetical protein